MQDVDYDDYADDSPKGMRRWLAVCLRWGGAVVSVAVLVLFVFWAYRLGVRDARDIPVIRASEGPIRVQPEDPGGTTVAHQGLEVNDILGGSEANPPTETALAPQVLPIGPDDLPPETARDAAPSPESAGLLPMDETLLIDDAVARALAEAAGEEVSEADLDLAPVAEDDTAAPASAAGIPRPLRRPADFATSAPRQDGDALAGLSEPPPPPVTEEPAPGTRMVQLGAFESADVAETQWQLLLQGHGDLLGRKARYIQQAESNGRVFYRLRVMGFDDQNAQRAICEALRARSVDCIPVTVR
ncbi:SPOR domain-containing protein [Halovulum dunhuangense]|uniref:SPOR domain-containing protein n=1 Tax=Halovulum dunhuangense TaxID=1505036 RepID=A0A849L1T0_9RHOB|nr:SPOR domain-containing protein [Halovulum dunhuangense]NNU80215.1 SPOR domain-containing protein [Halovulum dunhuangense]